MSGKDVRGVRFGRLVAIEPVGRDKYRSVLWRCVCDCGRETIVPTNSLKNAKSCGCLIVERTIERNTRHGAAKTKLYQVWGSMKQRCCNPNAKSYKNYGGRGITLCDEWMEFSAFQQWAKANGYAEGLEIDRIDNDKGYSPDNCRFVTRKQNCRNRRDNRHIEAGGERHTISEWADITGIPAKALQHRLCRGWSDVEAVIVPLGTKRKAFLEGVLR